MNSEDFSKNNVKYITALGSVAHTYGNLLATAQKWLLDIFPEDVFKTIHVQSRIAHSQILRTPHQFLKKTKPMIIFSPRVEYNEDDTFMAKTLITERMGGPHISGTPGVIDLNPFFFDPERLIDLQFSSTRRVMYIDVLMTFDTLMQQMNYMDYIKLQLPFERPFDIETWLEAYLSKELMEMVSTIAGVPIHDADGSVHNFISYMNGHSCFPVTYKLAGSTGKEEFYRYYPATIITKLSNLDYNQGEAVNHITTNYTISFTMRMEFWSPGIMYLFSNKVHDIPKPEIPTDSTLIPVFADVFMLEDLNLAPGWKVYGHASYTLDKPYDKVDFSSLMQRSITEVIHYHLKNGIPLLNFLDIKVRRMGKMMIEGKNADYEIDYANNIIQFHNKSALFYTHTVIISIDVQYINEMLKSLYDLE